MRWTKYLAKRTDDMSKNDFAAWGANSTRQPCKPDCHNRKAGCATECEAWAKYAEQKKAEYAKREQAYLVGCALHAGYMRRGGKA